MFRGERFLIFTLLVLAWMALGNVELGRAAAPTNCGTNGGYSGVRVLLTSGGNPPSGVDGFSSPDYAVPWGGEDFDTDSYHDTATHNDRLVAPVDGYYAITADLNITDLSGFVQIFVHNASGNVMVASSPGGGGSVSENASATVHMTAGDYAVVVELTGNGADLGATQSTNAPQSSASMTWLGQCSTSSGTSGATTLHDLTDVNDTGKTDGSVLKYDTATSKWIVGTDSVGSGGTSGPVALDDATTQRIDFVGAAIWFAIGLGLMLFVGTYTIKPLVGGRVAN